MDISEAIALRHSVRRYDAARPLTPEATDRLRCLIEAANRDSDLRLKLVTDEPHSFGDSLMARYGRFSGVRNYICVEAPDTADGAAAAGYHGEMLVLEARAMGLDTCWVGLTFKRKHVPVDVARGYRLMALIAIGYGEDHGRPRHSRQPGDISPDYDTAPAWFRRGIESVMLAPSALNSQQVRFRYLGDFRVSARKRFTLMAGSYFDIDRGIAMAHFEAVCPGIRIEWV